MIRTTRVPRATLAAITAALWLSSCADDAKTPDPGEDVVFLRSVLTKLVPKGISGPWVAYLTTKPLSSAKKITAVVGDSAFKPAGDYWFAFVDKAATGLFAHPTSFVFADKGADKLTVEEQHWWPLIDGTAIADAGVPMLRIFAPRTAPKDGPKQPAAGGGSQGPKAVFWAVDPDYAANKARARVVFDAATAGVVNVAADLDGDGKLEGNEWLLKNSPVSATEGWAVSAAFPLPLDSNNKFARQFWYRVAVSAEALPATAAWTGSCEGAACSDSFVTLDAMGGPAGKATVGPAPIPAPAPAVVSPAPCQLICEADKLKLTTSCKALVLNMGDHSGHTFLASESTRATQFFEARLGKGSVTRVDLPTVTGAVEAIKTFVKTVKCLDEAHIHIAAHGYSPEDSKTLSSWAGYTGVNGGLFAATNLGEPTNLSDPKLKQKAAAMFLTGKQLHDAITSAPHCPWKMNYYEIGKCRQPGYCNLNISLMNCYSGNLIKGSDSLALQGVNVLTAASDVKTACASATSIAVGEAFRNAFVGNKADDKANGGNGDGVTSNEEAMTWATKNFEGKGLPGPITQYRPDGTPFIRDAWDSAPQTSHKADCDCTCNKPATTCLVTDQPINTAKAMAFIFGADISDCQYLDIKDILHSAASVPLKLLAGDYTSVLAFFALIKSLDAATVNQLYNNTDFPCGSGPNGLTLCQQPLQSFPAGDTRIVINALAKAVPLADPKNHFQYAFVFDADGVTTNNYVPAAQYPNDFFKDTDRWYEALYTPTGGWTLKVTQLVANQPQTVTSAARITIKDNVVLLAVPASEFKDTKPKFRITAFRHTGDYGINPPHDWDGSVWPAVAKGLETYP